MLMGRSTSKTTEIYTFVSKSSLVKIKSPLDRFLESKKLKYIDFKKKPKGEIKTI